MLSPFVLMKTTAMRYKLTLEYDGTGLLGWQRQLDGPSAQEYLETAIACFTGSEKVQADECGRVYNPFLIFGKEPLITVQCAGRTDAGVHALAQVAHFDLNRDIDCFRLQEGLNAHLRANDIAMCVLKAEKVSDDFNARFSAVGRGYLYRIVNRRAFPALERNRVWWVPYPLDVDLMRQGAQYLLGQHDFTSFRAAACQAKSPIKTRDRLAIVRDGDESRFIVEARSFLHHQVRNMVGTLKMVGNRQIRPEEVKRILEARDRTRSGPNAPACGLYLNKVEY